MRNIFKEQSINQTKKIVDEIYLKWVESKSKYDEKLLDKLSDAICMLYETDLKHSKFYEKKEYWLKKFKNEQIIIEKCSKVL